MACTFRQITCAPDHGWQTTVTGVQTCAFRSATKSAVCLPPRPIKATQKSIANGMTVAINDPLPSVGMAYLLTHCRLEAQKQQVPPVLQSLLADHQQCERGHHHGNALVAIATDHQDPIQQVRLRSSGCA